MSKPNQATGKNKHYKKEINEEVLAHFQIEQEEQVPNSGRKRLKKLYEVNEDQEIVQNEEGDNHTEKLDEDQGYNQFEVKDDEELRKEREAEEEAKKIKSLKGNQKLATFLEKRVNGEEKDKKKKEKQTKPVKVQMTLDEMYRIKKQKKQRRKSSDDFVVSDNANLSQNQEREIQAKRMAAYEIYNGSHEDEKQLIQRAMKLSLQTPESKDIVKTQKHQNLNDYAYDHNQNHKETNVPKSKQVPKKQQPIKRQQNIKPSIDIKKQTKSKTKTTSVKQIKVGPLNDIIAVLTGQFQGYEKDQLIKVIQELGGECPKSLVKKCNLLIQGAYVMDTFKRRLPTTINQTAKSKEAAERGIRIIPNNEVDNFFIQKTGFDLQHHIDKMTNRPEFNAYRSIVNNPESNGNQNQPINMKVEKRNILDFIKNQLDSEEDLAFQQKMDIQYPKTNQKKQIKIDNRLWTEKYKPQILEEIITEGGKIRSLRNWIQAWDDIHLRGNKRPDKQNKGGWGLTGSINSNAALLSGDPGIGKTTTARILAVQYGYSITQFNASDVRNKSGINLLQTGSMNFNQSKVMSKSLLIMDEVDGMSSGDRGGIAAIINMIKTTKVPIICICNDRASQKIRSLANHCLDIRFQKPTKSLVVKRLKQILVAEGGSGQDKALEQLFDTFNGDMRQILTYLQVIFNTVSKRITYETLSNRGKHSKDTSVMINHSEAALKLINREEFKRMKIQERIDCFFVDSDMVPLMVHESILLSAQKTKMNQAEFHMMVDGLKGMVIGDLLDRTIRKEQQWGLMPSYGFMTCVYSTQKISQSHGMPNFPSWLGKFSSERKMKRLARQLKDYLQPVTLCASWKSVKNTYGPLILLQIGEMLRNERIQQACIFMQEYNISPLILNEHLVGLHHSVDKTDKTNPLSQVPSQVKTKLTKLFNKRHEEGKLKAQNKDIKSKAEHLKFDPVMEYEQDIGMQEQQDQNQQNSANTDQLKPKPKAKAAKPKNK